MDIRLILIDFLIVLFVMFSCIEAEGCTASSCKSQTCIKDGRGSSFCNNCTNGKVGLKCNIDNPCIGNDQCAIKNCVVLLKEGVVETASSVCLATCEGQSCSDPCESQPCSNNGLCVNYGDGSFNCKCPNQWKGPQCEEDVDECQSNPCKNSGTCENSRGTFLCLCMAGFNGSLCEINIDDCQGHACMNNGTCVDLVGSYRCQCPLGKAGLRCQVDDPCLSNPCKYESHCSVHSSGNYSCNCQPGLKGIHCDEDIDECTEAPREICEQGGTCVNKIGSFSCLCPYGLSGDRCEVPLNKCHENLCENGGTCLTLIGKYECYCLPGFSGDTCNVSGICQGIDCNGAGCSFVNGNYKCNCPANTTGLHCEFDLNGRCLKESCMEENCNKCRNGAKCSGRNSSVCECKPGFYGPLCQFNYCSSNPCRNGGTCIAGNNSYRCECLPSYEGDVCERFLDGCRDCLNGGSCISNLGSCMCRPGYSGDSCEVLPCQSQECLNGGSCQPNASSRLGYLCRCRAGYSGNNCEHFSLCEASKPCSNGGICTDLLVGFDCNCNDQWKGQNCSIPVCDNCKCCKKSGTCSNACNLEECKYIDKECKSLEKVDHPFEKCAQASHCSEVFKDGKCDSECNTEECLYDGFDCKIKSLNCPNETSCRDVFEDGHCDKQCYNLMCMWDGTDCDQKKETIQGVIVLKLFVHRNDFEKNLRGFLYDLSHQLTCMVKLNQDGAPAISDIDIPGFGKGVEVRLKLVFSSSLDACFNFVDTAGNFIKKFSENNTMTDFPIYDISTAPDRSGPSTSDQTPIFITIGTIFSLLMVALLVGLWMNKRRRVDKTWFPPGFCRSNKGCTRTATDQMSSGSEKQIIEGSDSFSEESFDTGTLSKASRATFPGDMSNSMAPSHLKVTHNPPSICVAATSVSYNHQIDYMTNSFRPQFNVPLQDDIFTKIINEAMCHYDQTGETPLHLAARYSRADAAQKFLENGADPNAQDHDGKTPLHVAIAADAVGVFQILLRCRCSVNVQTKDGTTPLICAVRLAVDGMVGDLIKAEADLNKTDDQGKTGLHWAAAVNNLDAAILLLHHGGINRDVQDDKGQTPLFLAAKEGSFNVAQLLLHNSASMDLADQLDRLPRDIAIEKKHYDIVKLLDEYLAKASQNRGQSNFSGHLLMSESTKGMKQKNKALPQSEVDGIGRSKKKRKIDMMDVVSDANQSEMFAANFHQMKTPHHFTGAPYSYIGGPSNAESKQMYNHVFHWNRQNQNEYMLKEHIRMRNQKGQKKKNDLDKWFIGSTGSSPTDSEFAVIQSPNEGSSGSPGYCNNGGVFLSPPEADHYQQHMLPAGDGVPRCMPASVIQRYHQNPAKNSQLIQTSYGRYDDTYHDRVAFSKSTSTSAPTQGKQNQPLVFQQYPTPPSQQFSPNGISSVAQVSCLNSTQRENLFETPSPGAGDQWVDISMITCMEPHSKQQIDNVNESSVC